MADANAGKPVVLSAGGTAWTALGLDAPGGTVVTADSAGRGYCTVSGIPAASAASAGRTVTVTGAAVGTYTATYTKGAVYCEYTARTQSAGTIAVPTGTAQPAGGQIGDAADVPYTGAAKSVSPTTLPVKSTSAPNEQSFVIVGSNMTVKGKPGIVIDGSTTGIEDGKAVIPYFRFPGQKFYA